MSKKESGPREEDERDIAGKWANGFICLVIRWTWAERSLMAKAELLELLLWMTVIQNGTKRPYPIRPNSSVFQESAWLP